MGCAAATDESSFTMIWRQEGKRLSGGGWASGQLAQRRREAGSPVAGSGHSGMAGSASLPPSEPTACLIACLPPQPVQPRITHSMAAMVALLRKSVRRPPGPTEVHPAYKTTPSPLGGMFFRAKKSSYTLANMVLRKGKTVVIAFSFLTFTATSTKRASYGQINLTPSKLGKKWPSITRHST